MVIIVANEIVESMLMKNISSEIDTISFYIKNLNKLNYGKNKKKIDTLILDSIKHIELSTLLYLDNVNPITSKLDPKAVEEAYKEETGLKEIYKFELNKIFDEKIQNVLKQLIAWEEKHEKIVSSLE